MMKRSVLALILILTCNAAFAQFSTGFGYSELYDGETVSAFKRHVGNIASSDKEGRAAGSEGEAAVASYLAESLSGYGVTILSENRNSFGLVSEKGDTLVSSNVIGLIQGNDPSLAERFIVVGARLDNLGTDSYTVDGERVGRIYYGANGNASGLATLIELARMLETNRILLRRSIVLVGFGASRASYAGARYFLEGGFSGTDRIDAMVNLDMLGTGSSGFYAFTSSNADLNSVVEAQNHELQPVKPSVVGEEPYPSDHRAFYGKEIPSVMFTTGRYPEHDTVRDLPSIIDFQSMERQLEYIYNFTVALSCGKAPMFNPSKARDDDDTRSRAVAYSDCDVRPAFLGSRDPASFLEKWVYAYLKYPEEAVRMGIQGRVVVDFIIDAAGNVKDVKVRRGVDPLLDDEAVRIISASPKWQPGRLRGKKVDVSVSYPVEFKLEKGKGGFGINGIGIKKKKK